MSATGALIEGAALPEVQAMVQLVRGNLIVHGLVVWSSGGRCGLMFSGTVDSQQWQSCPTNLEQRRVDEIVGIVKAGAVPLPIPPLGESKRLSEEPEAGEELPADLRRVLNLLEQLADALACDPDVVLRHGTELQNLDIAAQVIAAVEEVITGHQDRESAPAKLIGLRRSADQALLRRA